MTTPPTEQLRPSPPERYEEQAFHSLEQAEEELARGDARQAAEKIWVAAANALKAVCQQRGWNHRYHNHLRAAAYYLAVEQDRPDLELTFDAIQHMHTNFYEHQLWVDEAQRRLAIARSFCRDICGMRLSEPSDQDLTTAETGGQEARLRTLTRPLPAHSAFGPQFSAVEAQDLPPVRPPHTREVNR